MVISGSAIGRLHGLRENESGVASLFALPFLFVIILMFLHTLSYSVNVNRKIALQMAVDNAARNAAVAQADILSRIAVVNQAIANTYVQNNRMHVDYLLQRYAYDILRAFWYDSNEAAELEIRTSCPCSLHKPASAIYDSTYQSKANNSDLIRLDDIIKQIPHEAGLLQADGRYKSFQPFLGVVFPLVPNYNDRQYGVCSNGFWDQEYDEQEVPSTILHGRIATPDSIQTVPTHLVGIGEIYNMVAGQVNAGDAYWILKDRIIQGSDNLTMLNRELPRLVLMLDEYIYEVIRKDLDGIDTGNMKFFVQIGNWRYPYSRNTPLDGDYFGQYNSPAYFQTPEEEAFLCERGEYQGEYQAGQWARASFWQQYHETSFFNRYLDLNQLPSIAFWHSWFFQWICTGLENHHQYSNGMLRFAPNIGALRQPESLRMGYYPNLAGSNDTGARPCFDAFNSWMESLGEINGVPNNLAYWVFSYPAIAAELSLTFTNCWLWYRAQAASPRIVHGRSDRRWASWEAEENRELNCDYDRSAPAKPLLMREAMFGKGGSILIGASQPLVSLVHLGVQAESCQESQYAIAAARAGVHIPGDPANVYTTSWHREKEWNLFVDDWDAVMLPVARAWQDCRELDWKANGNTGNDILQAMKQALGNPADAIFEGNGNDILH